MEKEKLYHIALGMKKKVIIIIAVVCVAIIAVVLEGCYRKYIRLRCPVLPYGYLLSHQQLPVGYLHQLRFLSYRRKELL